MSDSTPQPEPAANSDSVRGDYEGCWLTVQRFDGAKVVVQRCKDCGSMVLDKGEHDRFHSILNSHAHAIAILTVSHLSASVHERYEAYDKIQSKRFDNWSADAFAEVVAQIDGSVSGVESHD